MTTRTRAARTVTWIAVAATVLALAGCGKDDPKPRPFDLAPGDATVCRAAATGNARTVYNTRAKAANTDLKTQVAKIYPGSTDVADKATLTRITAICTDHGFNATTS